MRKLLCMFGATLIFVGLNSSQAFAWETDYAQGANPTASAQYADPDEQFDAMAGGGGSVMIYNFGSGSSHVHQTTAVTDQSVHWSADRIRMVFGPDAHY